MAPPRYNVNALTNGTRIGDRVTRLTIGELPKQLLGARSEGRAYRRSLEDALIRQGRDVGVVEAHAIDTASSATIHAAICRWLLRQKINKMSPTDILSCSREIVKAKQDRDRAIKTLNLDKRDVDSIEVLYQVTEPNQLAQQAAVLPPQQLQIENTTSDTSKQNENGRTQSSCELCDGEGLSGKPCPWCGAEDGDEC